MLKILYEAANLECNERGYPEYLKWYLGVYDLKSDVLEFEKSVSDNLKEPSVFGSILNKKNENKMGRTFTWPVSQRGE